MTRETLRCCSCGTSVRAAAAQLALAAAIVTAPPSLAGDGPPAAERRCVFAHYMTCFTLDVAFPKQEIEIAQAHGLDGFAMDFGEWCDANGNPTPYVGNMDNMLEAAKQLGTGFKLLLTPEYSVQPVDRDPLQTRESHSRVIRGGSWGYYGYSQRARVREFNSQVCPGYICVGFRVAISEAGRTKLRAE